MSKIHLNFWVVTTFVFVPLDELVYRLGTSRIYACGLCVRQLSLTDYK